MLTALIPWRAGAGDEVDTAGGSRTFANIIRDRGN